MKTVYEEKYLLKGIGDANRLDVAIYYQKGDELDPRRGYFLSVCPVKSRGMIVTYEGWSGMKAFLRPVMRKSGKTEKRLIEKYDELFRKFVAPFCAENGYEIDC